MPKFFSKYFKVVTLVVLVFFLVGVKSAWSQDSGPTPVEKTAFEKQYEDYQAKIKIYDIKHQDYVLKRSQYIRFKTLTSQEDAFDAGLAMLLSRNDVLVSYFQSLKEKLKVGEDIPEDIEAMIALSIDDEIAWLIAHQNVTSTAGTLDDLVKDSVIASNQFNQKEVVTVYQSLSTFSLGKVLGYTKRTDYLFNSLKKKIDEIRNETREGYSFSTDKFQVLDRWMFDAETRIARAKQKNSDVQGLFTDKNLGKNSQNAISLYNTSINTLGQSQLFLKEANTFMAEVIRELKTAEN